MTSLFVTIEQVKTTLPTQAAAEELAAAVVEKRLAACVQIAGPILSIYRWQGSVNRDQEFSLCCKTTALRLPQLIDYLRTHHPYDLPEIVTCVLQSTTDYSAWLIEQVDSPSGP